MRFTIRSKVTCGFLILAFGMMVSDCYRLLRTPSEAALSAAQSVQPLPRL
jgi:hypothetical protein